MQPSTRICVVLVATLLAAFFPTTLIGQIDESSEGEIVLPTGTASDDDASGFDVLSKAIPDQKDAGSGAGPLGLFGNGTMPRSMIRTAATLVFVISLFLLFVFLTKRKIKKPAGGLPSSVIQILGQMPLDAHQQLRLIRMGDKVLLVASTQNHSQTLSEITDPQEVLRIVSQCQAGQWPDIATTPAEPRSRPRPAARPNPRTTLLEA